MPAIYKNQKHLHAGNYGGGTLQAQAKMAGLPPHRRLRLTQLHLYIGWKRPSDRPCRRRQHAYRCKQLVWRQPYSETPRAVLSGCATTLQRSSAHDERNYPFSIHVLSFVSSVARPTSAPVLHHPKLPTTLSALRLLRLSRISRS